LREVKLLEKLRHPNIITYHHSWLETARFSSFGLPIPTLQCVSLDVLVLPTDTDPWFFSVLMEWAELGSLDDLIDSRLGKAVPGLQNTSGASDADDVPGVANSVGSNQGVQESTKGSTGASSTGSSFPASDGERILQFIFLAERRFEACWRISSLAWPS
jgi:serine/threonine protein kinase